MPDWNKLVRERLGPSRLTHAQEAEVVMELATHLEELYKEQLALGMSESQALERVLTQDVRWQLLAKNIERVKRKEEMMNSRTKQLWLPGLLSLAASMGWMMILQKVISPAQTPWKHAGVPVLPYLLWAITLPLIGAASGYLAHRAGSSRPARFAAVLFPSIVMSPIWLFILAGSHHPVQWANFCLGVLFWVVAPGAALLAGAWPFLTTSGPQTADEVINLRTKTFWLPALTSLTASMVILMISTLVGLSSIFVARGLSNQVVYLPWLCLLPLCGAAGARSSRRAGGRNLVRLAAGLFPAITMLVLGSFLTLTGMIVFAKPQLAQASIGLILGVVLPGAALSLGTLPLLKPVRSGI